MFKTIMPILRCPCCGESFTLMEDKIEEGEILEGKSLVRRDILIISARESLTLHLMSRK